MSKRLALGCLAGALFMGIVGCSGGSGGGGRTDQGGATSADFDCDGSCANLNLTAEDVVKVIQNASAGAEGLGVNATFAVVDRVGNVLAVYAMPGANPTTTIDGKIGAQGGLEGVTVPAAVAAISKAGTGAYLSSQGNAFSTRTASQIIQENFLPGERNQPGGPLFGVQFSQLICSDVTVRNADVALPIPAGNKFTSGGLVGPRPLPLGLSADSGGLPLYKNGDLVGGIGVEFDGKYTLDRNLQDFDDDPEERIALTATLGGFEAPSQRIAPNMNVGKSLRYTDLSYDQIAPLPETLPALDPAGFVAIPEYTNGLVKAGAVFGDPSSGYTKVVRAGLPAAILTSADGTPRFPTRSGTGLASGNELVQVEVDAILDSALATAFRGRAAIRRPLDSSIRVSIWVVDTLGNVLGFVRTQDAPVFGTDVALQKARSATFFSSPDAAAALDAVRVRNAVGGFEDYVGAAANFSPLPLLTGGFAISDRAIGNLARPFFTDGINDNVNGPFSLPFPGKNATGQRSWSPFNDGLQLDLTFQRLVGPLGVPAAPTSIPDTCTDSGVLGSRLGNGLQIFAGAVPLYRNGELVGGLGISGDGIDQDDMVAFFGASRPGLDFVGHTTIGDPELGFNSPKEIRSDTLSDFAVPGTRLRYVNCPEGPFIGDNNQNVCDGL